MYNIRNKTFEVLKIMDSFNEQLVKIKKSGLVQFCQIFIWAFAILISAACLSFIKYTPLVILVAAAIIYGAYRLNGLLNIEFEYILTNGTVDIDKITNKSSRKRIVSFECNAVESVKKTDKSFKKRTDIKSYMLTDDLNNAYVFEVSTKTTGRCEIVFSPNEKFIDSLKLYIPRSVSNSVWK